METAFINKNKIKKKKYKTVYLLFVRLINYYQLKTIIHIWIFLILWIFVKCGHYVVLKLEKNNFIKWNRFIIR